ncbi:chemotaxis protein CheD [Candidatus Venteria ishoeyi]|uniref:chemotaxis protein CheD n=1 Tax=Candidatus Venteria ishoeyi TaxID=1899563 RepID=UPI00255CE25A|nr:chemotaxis protein CheD [Candidatus Venteria ishoeyi]MDM8545943.1 chemotaxis protein CheD [Candidatus Venteria ishoeyi]
MPKILSSSQNNKEIFLYPGDLYFGQAPDRVRTLLGSCVAITLWHPRRHLGGMCHYMLRNPKEVDPVHLNGRYAEDAVLFFLQQLKHYKTPVQQYQVKIFGGGNMFPNTLGRTKNNIGQQNMRVGRALLRTHGFQVESEHLGGLGHRRIIFDLKTGQVLVHHTQNSYADRKL